MRYLTGRQEIADAMNFGKHPVLKINMETPVDGFEDFYQGSKVKVSYNSRNHGTLHQEATLTYSDGKFTLQSYGFGIHDSFGYYDVMKMAEKANYPILHGNQEVVVVMDYPKRRECKVAIMQMGKVSPHCSCAATLS